MAQDPGEIHTAWDEPGGQAPPPRLRKHHCNPIFRQLNLIDGALERQCGSPCRDMRFGLGCKLCLDLKEALFWTAHGPQVPELGSQRQQHALFAIGNKTRSSFFCHRHMYVLHVRVNFSSPSLAIESNLKRKSLKVGTE